MDASAQCPNGCGEMMRRVSKPITLQYNASQYSVSRWRGTPQTHDAYYICMACDRKYVSSVFKRFKETNVV